jgi:hypothetical protein
LKNILSLPDGDNAAENGIRKEDQYLFIVASINKSYNSLNVPKIDHFYLIIAHPPAVLVSPVVPGIRTTTRLFGMIVR